MSVLTYAKGHPYQIAGGLFAVGVLLVLLLSPKKQAQTIHVQNYDPGYDAAQLAANSSIQNASLAASAHGADTQAALQLHLAENDAALHIANSGLQSADARATMTAAYAGHIADLNAGVDMGKLSTAFELAKLGHSDNLAMIDNQKFAVASNNDTTLGLAAINAGVQIHGQDTSFAINGQNVGAHELDSFYANDVSNHQIQAAYDTNVIDTNSAERVSTLKISEDAGVALHSLDVQDNANVRATGIASQKLTNEDSANERSRFVTQRKNDGDFLTALNKQAGTIVNGSLG